VDPDRPAAAPWEPAAELLARLHATPATAAAPDGLPPSGGTRRVARAIARLRAAAPGDDPHAATVLRAYATLPGWIRAGAPGPSGGQGSAARPAEAAGEPEGTGGRPEGTGCRLVHGDWHLGQLVRLGGDWRLIDVDDLGTGDPAWDLARPAAWFAAGLLPSKEWERFLAAYREAGGSAVPPTGDPWAALELPARALTIQTAALGVAAAARAGGGTGRPLDSDEEALVAACGRIVTLCPALS
jgi:aminoglycoside phosphotransferase (APT) family kinase protein